MFRWFTRKRLLVVGMIVALALATVSGTGGAQSVETDSSTSAYAAQRSAFPMVGTWVTPTPRNLYYEYYTKGLPIYTEVVTMDGQTFQPMIKRIYAQDQMYYMYIEFMGHKLAASERDGAVWDTQGEQSNNYTWTFTSMDVVILLAKLLLIYLSSLEGIATLLLLIALALVCALLLYVYYRHLEWKDKFGDKDLVAELRASNQFHNSIGVPLWWHPRYEVANHPASYWDDMRWLADHEPGLGRMMHEWSNVDAFLNTGTPAPFTGPPPAFQLIQP